MYKTEREVKVSNIKLKRNNKNKLIGQIAMEMKLMKYTNIENQISR